MNELYYKPISAWGLKMCHKEQFSLEARITLIDSSLFSLILWYIFREATRDRKGIYPRRYPKQGAGTFCEKLQLKINSALPRALSCH